MDHTTLEGYRLSPQQKRLWQLQQAGSPYLAQCLIRIDGPANAEVLRRKVLQVVMRHDILRTSFESLPGMGLPLQVVGDAEAALCWSETELRFDADETLSRLMQDEALLYSSTGVVLRASLVKGAERQYLCLTLPALCADRRTLYNVFSEIVSDRPAEETVQYVQFSEWQHQMLEELEAGREPADEETIAIAKLTLPFEGQVKGPADFVTLHVDEATTSSIVALSREEEFSLEDFLLTCWHILLWRLTGEERVAVLKQFDGRKFKELYDCCGLIDSYFPVSLRCTSTMRFREALRKVAAATREEKHRVVQAQESFEDPEPIGFVFEEPQAATPGLSMHYLYSKCERFKVQLAATLADGSLKLTVRYRPDLFDSANIRRISHAYRSLLAGAAKDPEARIGKLNILPDEERQRLFVECNATVADSAIDSCIHQYFENAVERAPDAIAVEFQDEQLSFRELNRRANQLAHHLRARGVAPETRVGLLLHRSIDMIVATLAVMKAGGAYLPLDPAVPEERLLYTLADAQASLLITQTRLSGNLGEVLYLDEARESIALESDENPINHTLPENLAYIIYTSGSTGKPKGVMIQHRSVVNLFEALNRAIYRQHESSLRVSVNAPFAFDASVKQLIQLLNCYTLRLIPEEVRPNGEELLALIAAEQMDVLDCTPSQLKMLFASGLINDPRVSSLVTLVGGEAIDESVWEQIVKSSTHTFYNVYGPTECTVDATVCRVTQALNVPSIGRPLANVQAVVLDWNGEPALPGVSGELCVGGEGLARGYTGDPALTAERFIPSCFAKTPGARLYRTGDYARHLPDGNIRFLGRQDDQVKLRGLRIEPGEIESALREHPAVADACVVVREDQPGNHRLVSYTVAKRKDAIDGYARYELGNGLAIAHQNRNDTSYLYQEIFEDEVYLRYGIKLPEHACVFDVGANIGLFTIFVAERCPDARIYAFEPLAPIFNVLRINSKLSGANTKLFAFGLSNVEKSETFTYYPQYPSRSGLSAYADAADEVQVIKKFLANKQEAGVAEMSVMLAEADDLFAGSFHGELLECRVRRLSDVIRDEGIEHIDLLKIDVQRAELDVLEGIDDDDWKKIQQVVIEVHDASGTYTDGRLRKIVSLFEKHGFHTTAEQDPLLKHTDRYTVYALQPQQENCEIAKSETRSLDRISTSHFRNSQSVLHNGDASLTPAALREFLSRKVPEYMIPTAFVLLDSFPLNRNGKINRKELPAPVAVENATKEARQLTPFEELLALIWMDVLGTRNIGPKDNFFEQGGHSLLATRLISRVRESFSIELPLRSVFESPTLEGLAQRVASAKQKTHADIPAVIPPAARDRRLPLSFAQERLWFLNQLEPDSFVYNCPCALSLTGPLNVEVLEQTLTEIVRRHESLRTTFAQENGEPYQVIHTAEPVKLEVLDLPACEDRETKRRELIAAEAREPFDLSRGPLFRVRALRLSELEHVVLFTTHHIVSDGWSMGVLVREVAALYQAFSKGEASPLTELNIQYADFAVWQRDYLEGRVLDEQLNYWKDQLRGAPALLELPTDRPRPAVQTYRGATRRMAVPREVSEQLRRVCRSEGVTLFMLLSAAFKVLLYRYTRQTDIVVGTDIAGRDRQEIEGLVGFFINQLALRTQLNGDDTFRAVLQREREICLEAFTHQAAPFERVVEELNPVRSLSHSPVFQVSFTLNNTPVESAELTGLEMRRLDAGVGIAKFDLTLTMVESGDHLGGAFEYNADLFDAASIDRIAGHFQTLLGSIATPVTDFIQVWSTKTCIDELPLLSAAERAQLLIEWNDTARDISSSPTLLHGLFEAQARRTPDAIAAVGGEQNITYAELDLRASTLARRVREHGVGPERLAGILMDSSIEMLVTMLGVLKAGGAYVPLDPRYPRERLLYMMTDARVMLLLTQKDLEIEAPGVPVLYVDSRTASQLHDASEVVEVSPENTAYVLYTSGSTGQPKGVVVNHRAIVNYTLAMCDEFGLSEDDRMLQFASPSFDVLLEEVFPALACGASVVFVEDRDSLLSCAELARIIDRYNITGCELPAPYWHELVAHLQRSGETAPPTLRLLLVGCERPSPQCITQWTEWGHALVYVFGITETTITSTLQKFVPNAGEQATPLQISIGKPVANTESYVLDQRLEPVPIGVTAELYLGGAGVSRGYLDRPELTAGKFIPHPFSNEPGARLYRTGDMARYFADGRIEFTGRVDEQVKISGYRIEPREVKAAIESYPGVLECFVDARKDEPGGQVRLVGYVVSEDETKFAAGSLRSYLKETLPDYMIPSCFVSLRMLPLTANGKIDRQALPAPGFHSNVVSDSQLPVTPAEELVAEIFAKVLRVERVGRHQDFFELGGHSLLATQLVSRLREAFAVELPLRSVFETPTVSGLSRSIEAERSGGRSAQFAELRVAERNRPLPLSFAQQRLWFIEQLEPESVAYNNPAAMRISGPLNLSVLEATFTEIARRHESLRTVFPQANGEPYQLILPPQPFALAAEDLSFFSPAEREKKAAEMAAAEAQWPFDLAIGPLFRARVLKLAEEEHVLLFTMHHIISDGWSMGVLVREVATLYDSFSRGEASPLPEPAIQYGDYAVWQRQYLEGAVLDEQLSYWRAQLAGAPVLLELPADRPRPAVQTYRGASRSLGVPKELTEQLRALCREQGVTLFMLLSAAFKVLLYRYTGQRDVVIGTDIAGRNRPEIEGLVGFFVNQLALRTELRGEEPFRQLLRRERETCLQAFTHQDAPFERVVEELNPVRSLSHSPVFQVSFSFDNMQLENAQLSGLEMRPISAAGVVAKFDLTLTIAEIGERLGGAFLYNADLFDASTMDRLAAHFQNLLGSIVTGMETRVGDLRLFPDTERTQLLTEWNRTTRDYSGRPVLLHGLFEEQARRTPDATAAVCGEESITYAELDQRANTLATRLRVSGVGPGQLAGVLMDGSIEMLAAMLGVLKAGAGYVPLDPRYPRERLVYMLRDAQVGLLLTRKESAARLQIETEAPVFYLDGWTDLPPRAAVDPVEVAPESTAYVIYTSGSTGQPKGVVVSHRAIANYTLAMCDELQLRGDDRMLQFASPSFDVLLEELFPALASGACVVFVDDRDRLLSCNEFIRIIAEHSVTACELPTPFWHELVAHLSRSWLRPPASLRLLMVGCERPSIDCIAQWAGWGLSWIYVFGITETTITSTLQRFESQDHVESLKISIGKPVANTKVYILDQQLEPVPFGVAAELYLGGAGLACGYLNQPGLTAVKFLPDPFGKDGGARLYKTGDSARYLPDGRLEFIGRVDNQVKIRGYRVELAEIEAALSLHPAVHENVVLAFRDGANSNRLIAYVSVSDGAEKSSGELKGFLKERLPEYMVPSVFVFVERLPLTPNGKLDRSALPEPGEAKDGTENGSPVTPVEELLVALWSELLRVEHVSTTDDFFELGGHSLLATQLVSRVRESFGVELSLRTLFDQSTISGLGREIELALRDKAGVLTRPIVPVGRAGPLPLSFAQQRLWFFQQLEPESVAYNSPSAMRITGPLNLSVLEQAFTEVERRHESLRTVFPQANGEPYQLILPPQAFPLAFADLSAYSPAEREKKAAEMAAAEAQWPFDLAIGPLFRARVLKLAEEEHVLLFTMHHIISDGWSMGVLVREVATLYDSFSRGEASPLPEPAIQYGDYAVWQRQYLEGAVLDEQLSYWRAQLAGAPVLLELPADRPRPAVQTYRGASRSLGVPKELTEQLRALCREQGVTLFMLLLATFKVLLYRYSGQTDIVVGTPVAGRNLSELQGLVGFFANTLALRSRVSAGMSFRDLLRQVRQASVDAYVHQDVPFEKLVEELAPERAATYTPIFQVMLAFEDLPKSSLPMTDLQFTPFKAESETAKFDLTMVLVAAGPFITGTLEYSTDLYDAPTIEKMLGHYHRLLTSIVSSPDSPINALEMLSEEEVGLLNTPVAIAELEESFSF